MYRGLKNFSITILIAILLLIVKSYGFANDSYFISIDNSGNEKEHLLFMIEVKKVIQNEILKNIKKGDFVSINTYSDKIYKIVRKEIFDFKLDKQNILSEVTNIQNNNNQIIFYEMFYKTIQLILNNFNQLNNNKYLFIFSKSFPGKENKYSKNLLKLTKTGIDKIIIMIPMNSKINNYIQDQTKTPGKVFERLKQISNFDILFLGSNKSLNISLPKRSGGQNRISKNNIGSNHITLKIINENMGYIWIIVIFIVLIIIGIFIYLKKFYKKSNARQQYFYGYFEYFDTETTKPLKKYFDLALSKKNEIIISGRGHCDILLRGNYKMNPIVLCSPVGDKKAIQLAAGLENQFKFIKQLNQGYLSHGDSFKIGSYQFHYNIR